MSLRFCKFSKSHIEDAYRLGKRHFGLKSEYSWDWSREKIAQYTKPSFGYGIVCMEGKKHLAGFVLVEKEYSSQRPKVAWLTYIAVDPRHKHKNIGSHLLEKAMEKLEKIGKNDMITDIYCKNTKSIKFFAKNKFKIKEKWYILSRKI